MKLIRQRSFTTVVADRSLPVARTLSGVGEVPSFSTLAIHRSIDLLAEDNTIELLYDLSEADF